MEKKIIAVVAGGDSSEHGVSMKSASGISSWIDKDTYTVYIVELHKDVWHAHLSDGSIVEVDRGNFSFVDHGKDIHPDYAYITVHGTPGEDGLLQGYFELIGIPYSTCNVLVSALTFNKFSLNQYLKGFGVKIADSILVRKGMSVDSQSIADELGLPCFVKPNGAGSSFGVTKCKSAADILPAIEKAHEECDEVLIESLLEGMEVSNGVYRKKDGTINVLPITEIVSHNEYFDFNAKYNGEVEEITPARLSDETTSRVQALTSHIYDILGARGIIRVDYFISKKQNSDGSEVDVITLLEINGTPGMTPTSFIPQQAAAAGLEMKDVLNEVISI